MRAGQLKNRIQIDAKTVTKNSLGESIETWTLRKVLWSQVHENGIEEVEISGAMMTVRKLSLSIRYRADILMTDSILWCGHRYEITSIDNVDMKNNELAIRGVSYES